MYLAKDWYKSKLIWLGIVAALFNILGLLGLDTQLPATLQQDNVVKIVNAIFGVLAILFRWNSDTAIAQSSEGKKLQGIISPKYRGGPGSR